MKNSELQTLLKGYPDDMPIKLLPKSDFLSQNQKSIDFDSDNIMLTSEAAYVNENAPEDEWDCEDGKVELGDGQQYLLINPIII